MYYINDDNIDIDVNETSLSKLINIQNKYGNIVSFNNSSNKKGYFINDPLLIKNILIRNYSNFKKGSDFKRIEMLMGNGLIVSDGDHWRRSRMMIQPTFSRKNINTVIEQMISCSKNRESNWNDAIKKNPILNITKEMNEFALELILKSIFSTDYHKLYNSSDQNLFAFLSEDSRRDLSVAIKMRNLRSKLLRIVEKRKQSPEHGVDFLSMLINARDKFGNKFSDKQLIDEVITIVVAGYETSAGTLNWIWYLLSLNPLVKSKIREETKCIFDNTDNLDIEYINKMEYTQCVIDETLRLYPPVWLFSRKSITSDSVDGFNIDSDADLYLSPFILHRCDDFWENPNLFNPDRFSNNEMSKKRNLAYFPFSLGPRRCLGEYFSFLEMKIHLGYLINRFDIVKSNFNEPKLNLGINLRSDNDIYLQVESL